jgi:hypothetical protein
MIHEYIRPEISSWREGKNEGKNALDRMGVGPGGKRETRPRPDDVFRERSQPIEIVPARLDGTAAVGSPLR